MWWVSYLPNIVLSNLLRQFQHECFLKYFRKTEKKGILIDEDFNMFEHMLSCVFKTGGSLFNSIVLFKQVRVKKQHIL